MPRQLQRNDDESFSAAGSDGIEALRLNYLDFAAARDGSAAPQPPPAKREGRGGIGIRVG
jgi:hypothetical protein